MLDLRGQRVVVFGGSSGIGFATAQMASAAGAEVTIASRNRARLERAARQLVSARTAELDLRESSAVFSFFEGRPAFNHVIVTAAELQTGPLRTMSLDTAFQAFDSKFWGAVHVAHAANIEPSGSLTFVSGLLGIRPSGNATILSAINAAVEALARALATEMAPIRVNCVSPGRIDSPWWDFLSIEDKERLLDRTAAILPVRRIGRPEEIGALILHVIENSYITGAVLQVDGGGSVS
ncbi:SDR family oxidoreductase [Rhizobium leguminosarum]|uniref:SDR family oxidoreductase n=1 Tax=Rhizobium leguminosarum TaxID=384 RepID=UPI003F9A1790